MYRNVRLLQMWCGRHQNGTKKQCILVTMDVEKSQEPEKYIQVVTVSSLAVWNIHAFTCWIIFLKTVRHGR